MGLTNGIVTNGIVKNGLESYKISWLDITSDGGHATADEFDKFECSKMVSYGYVYKKTKKFLWTFASYDQKDEAYSDRNVYPIKCIIKMEKLNV